MAAHLTGRRFAASLLLGLFLALLANSARHDHTRHSPASAEACIFCGAALGPVVAIPEVPRAVELPGEIERSSPRAPERSYLLKLDHSGGAPPAA